MKRDRSNPIVHSLAAPNTELIAPKITQDLDWLLSSPSLLNATSPDFADFVSPDATWKRLRAELSAQIQTWSFAPQALEAHVRATPRSYKLGIYAEALLDFALRHCPSIRVLASHLPVYAEKTALGEFDFVTQELQTGALFHWELAIKFFVCRWRDLPPEGQRPQMSDWIGPQGLDSLENKITKMRMRQLKLGQTPEGKKALIEKGGVDSISLEDATLFYAHAITRGWFFYHYDRIFPAWQEGVFHPDFVSPQALGGWWFRSDEVSDWAQRQKSDSSWVSLAKPQWLGQLAGESSAQNSAQTLEQLCQTCEEHFRNHNRAILWIEIDSQTGRERSRGFVLHPTWPEPAPENFSI
jgi:hypothetical protein